MVFAYLLVGAVVVFGIYWTIKYIMLPSSERRATSPNITECTSTEAQSSETSSDSTDSTLPPITTTTTEDPNICSKGFGYRYVARSGFCYKLSAEKLPWQEGAQACKEEGARLSGAFQRRQERDLLLLFAKERDEPVIMAAVGVKPAFKRGHYFMYDYESEKRIDRSLRAFSGPTHLDTGSPQQYAYINPNLEMYWFSAKFFAEYICEYKLKLK